MNRARSYYFVIIIVLTLIMASCGLTTDIEEMHSIPLPNLENTGGDAGGSGGSNPPPPGE